MADRMQCRSGVLRLARVALVALVAKREAGDPSVSLDRLIRTLLTSGSTSQDIAEAIATAES
ncbi:MAG: hypothetical protein ACREMR_00475 [Gemmatimonadales bacterium]